MTRTLRIGTRRSALALAQARSVASLLPGSAELVEIVTAGDRLQEQNPAAAGGRGIFVGELHAALRRGEVDLCVHSAKDVPPEGHVAAYPPRGDPRDCLVGRTLAGLAPGSCVATGSPRRAAQLSALRPDLRIEPLRGNVDTRLRRVAEGAFAAAVLAVAGLSRLGRADAIAQIFDPSEVVPAAGQGALAIVTRPDDAEVLAVVQDLNEPVTAFCVEAERAVLAALGGGCSIPAGAFCAREADGGLRLRAVARGADGALLRVEQRAEVPAAGLRNRRRAQELGHRAAEALLAGGAAAVLTEAGDAE